jgi:hypothetical protein
MIKAMETYAFQAEITHIRPIGLTVRAFGSILDSPAASPKDGSPGALLK